MAFRIVDSIIGSQPIADTSATQLHPLGTIVRAVDPTYGVGEFIYLKGVASTAIGDLVDYDNNAGTTTRTPATGGTGPIAVAMSANLLGYYGWYQISGLAVVRAPNTVVVGADAYMLAATPGSVDDAVVANEGVLGMKFASLTGVPSAGFALAQCGRLSHGITTP
jgi:hypothetical protein